MHGCWTLGGTFEEGLCEWHITRGIITTHTKIKTVITPNVVPRMIPKLLPPELGLEVLVSAVVAIIATVKGKLSG